MWRKGVSLRTEFASPNLISLRIQINLAIMILEKKKYFQSQANDHLDLINQRCHDLNKCIAREMIVRTRRHWLVFLCILKVAKKSHTNKD